MASLGGLTPGDVRLPNRRTAVDPVDSPAPKFDSELSAIRHELNQIQEEMLADVQKDSAQADLEEEVTNLYHQLQQAAGTLEKEKSLRKKVESQLEALRTGRLRETAEVVEELEKKRTELQTLRDERAMMKEWLDRGVAECKRVADDVVRLKTELDTSEKACSALSSDKHRLTTTVQELSDELANVQFALEKLHHDKGSLELKAEESVASLSRAEEERKSSVVETDRLAAEMQRLQQRVRGLEDAEVSMQSMCNSMDALCQEINLLEGGVAYGNLDDLNSQRPPITEAGNDIADVKPLAVMVVDAKRLLQQLQDSLSRLRASVRRYMADNQRKVAEQFRNQTAELDAVRKEREILILTHQQETEQLRERVVDLEREIVHIATGVQRDISSEASTRLNQLDKLSAQNRQLAQDNDQLKGENERLKAKAKKMKIDWSKVDESRRRYQQLQVEVQLMKDYSDKLVHENRNLKVMMEARQDHGTRKREQSSELGSGVGLATSRQAFEEWRKEAMRSSMSMPNSGTATSPPHAAGGLSVSFGSY